MIVTSSVVSLATIVVAASMSFTAQVMPIGTGAPSHIDRDVRIASHRPSSVESTRGQASAARNGGTASVTSNLVDDRDGNMGNRATGATISSREGLPSMTHSSEGVASTFR